MKSPPVARIASKPRLARSEAAALLGVAVPQHKTCFLGLSASASRQGHERPSNDGLVIINTEKAEVETYIVGGDAIGNYH